MQRLIEGVRTFHTSMRNGGRAAYGSLADEQKPHTLFFACSDSRVVPAVLSTSEPGDVFTVRNVGNLVPPSAPDGGSLGDRSEASAIEYAVERLRVQDIVVCGHSGCGAMGALSSSLDELPQNLRRWLDLARPTCDDAAFSPTLGAGLPRPDQLSQRNVVLQLRALASYPSVNERVSSSSLRLHGWWFDIRNARIEAYDSTRAQFVDFDRAYRDVCS